MSATVTPVGTVTRQRPGTRAKVGLGIAIVGGLMNLPSVLTPTPEGETGPPFAILLMSTALGLVTIVAAVWAWRTGSRPAIRVAAASLIVNTVGGLPGLFVDIPAVLKVATAVVTLLTVAAVVLMFSRPRPAATTG